MSDAEKLSRLELLAQPDYYQLAWRSDREALRWLLESREKHERQLTAALRELEACRHLLADLQGRWISNPVPLRQIRETIEAADLVLKEAKTQARRDAS